MLLTDISIDVSPQSYYEYHMDQTAAKAVSIVSENGSYADKTSDGLKFVDADNNVVSVHSITPVDLKRNVVMENLEQRIFHRLHFPDRWVLEGIARPYVTAKEKSYEVCKILFTDYYLIPDTILPTKEEGVYLAYNQTTEFFDRTMMIEIYNTMEIAVIVCDNSRKETIHCEDISEMDFSHAVSIFKA